MTLEFDGNDYYVLPALPGNGNDDFDITFDYYFLEVVENQFIFNFYEGGGFHESNLRITPSNVIRFKWQNSSGNGNIYGDTLVDATWYNIRITKINGLFEMFVGSISQGTSQSTGNFDFNIFWMGIGNEDQLDFSTCLINGSKIKDMTGTYEFGTPYLDYSRNHEAEELDHIASIKNTGSLGGYIQQITSDKRAVWWNNPAVVLEFDGNDDYVIPKLPGNGSGDFEIEFDFYNVDLGKQYLFSWWNVAQDQYMEIRYFSRDYWVRALSDSDSMSISSSGDKYPPGTWNHIKVTKSGTTFELFVNGVSIGSDVCNGTFNLDGLSVFGAQMSQFNGIEAGGRIKNLTGDIYEFGSAYTDIARTIEADIGDNIASIENTGLLGGYIEQSTSDNQSTLIGAYTVRSYIGIGEDYETVQDWIDDRNGEFEDNNELHKGILINNKEYEISSAMHFSGSVTNRDHYWWLTADDSVKHNGIPGSGARIKATSAINMITSTFGAQGSGQALRLSNIELNGNSTAREGIRHWGDDYQPCFIMIDSCIIHDIYNSVGTAYGIRSLGEYTDFTCRNSIIYNIQGKAAAYGIYSGQENVELNHIMNNIVAYLDNDDSGDISTGIWADYFSLGNHYCYNNIAISIIGDTSSCFHSNFTDWPYKGNNISSDTTAPGSNSFINAVTNDLFVDASNGNFRLKFGSDAKNNGYNLSAFFLIDIVDVLRPQISYWDIGSFEYLPDDFIDKDIGIYISKKSFDFSFNQKEVNIYMLKKDINIGFNQKEVNTYIPEKEIEIEV
ncbi:MAG: LamG-like jellyroll fold domain-containing protein [Candidatus Heimdallarchaeaceae archaeon]|jgi:hypothetical protein